MAEPPETKRPSRSKKAPEPDFSPFEDWLIDGPAGKWPGPWEPKKELSPEQQQIVRRNADLLRDRDAWLKKVQAFEAALSALADAAQQKETRAKYHIRFDRHGFADGDKPFSDYPFPCSVSFIGARFGDGSVSFQGSTFGDGSVSFHGSTFGKGEVSFRQVSFGEGDVSFRQVSFGEGDVSFIYATFGRGEVEVSFATFGKGDIWFLDTRFGDGEVSFDWVTFGDGWVCFDEAELGEGLVTFQDTTFAKGKVSFRSTKFGEGNVSFRDTSFGEGDVSFDHARFGDRRCNKCEVSLRRTKFGEGSVSFGDIDFRSIAVFAYDMVVAGNLYVESRFPEAVNFSRLDVKGTASFSGSSFAIVPDFTDAKFDRPPEVAGMEVPRPSLGRGGGRSELSSLSRALFSTALDAGDVAKYRKLKAMALAANDHEKDGEFFAYEMLAKRGAETTSFAGLLFNTFYWKLSDFGQSFTLPLKWMCGLILVFAAINVAVVQIGVPSTLATIPSRFGALAFSAVLSLKNAIPLLGTLFRFAPAPDGHDSWFQSYYDTLKQHTATADWLIGLGVMESILGGVLLFLFLLALRNKFRLK